MDDYDENKISKTKENEDDFLDFLYKKQFRWLCPVCGHDKFEYPPKANPITFPRLDIEKNRIDLSQNVPAYWVFCKSCFNMTFFHIKLVNNFYDIKNKEQEDNSEK